MNVKTDKNGNIIRNKHGLPILKEEFDKEELKFIDNFRTKPLSWYQIKKVIAYVEKRYKAVRYTVEPDERDPNKQHLLFKKLPVFLSSINDKKWL